MSREWNILDVLKIILSIIPTKTNWKDTYLKKIKYFMRKIAFCMLFKITNSTLYHEELEILYIKINLDIHLYVMLENYITHFYF